MRSRTRRSSRRAATSPGRLPVRALGPRPLDRAPSPTSAPHTGVSSPAQTASARPRGHAVTHAPAHATSPVPLALPPAHAAVDGRTPLPPATRNRPARRRAALAKLPPRRSLSAGRTCPAAAFSTPPSPQQQAAAVRVDAGPPRARRSTATATRPLRQRPPHTINAAEESRREPRRPPRSHPSPPPWPPIKRAAERPRVPRPLPRAAAAALATPCSPSAAAAYLVAPPPLAAVARPPRPTPAQGKAGGRPSRAPTSFPLYPGPPAKLRAA